MNSVNSKASIYPYYRPAIICLYLGAIIAIYSYLSGGFDHFIYNGDIIFWLFTGIPFLAVYTMLTYFLNSPQIEVNNLLIRLNSRKIYWNEVENIQLIGKYPFPNTFRLLKKEGIMLELKDGRKLFLFDDFYSNSWMIKSYIHQVIIDEKESAEFTIPPTWFEEINLEEFKYFKHPLIITLRAIVPFFLLFKLISMISGEIISNLASPIALLIYVLIIGLGITKPWNFYCFGLSENYLVIKHQKFSWVHEAYKLDDIISVTFDPNHGSWGNRNPSPNALIITLKDYRKISFRAASLWNRDWKALKDEFEKHDIKVNDNLYYYWFKP